MMSRCQGIVLVCSLLLTPAAVGQCLPTEIYPSDTHFWQLFGRSVSTSFNGETVVIGTDKDRGQTTGVGYVFVRQGSLWIQQAKLIGSDTVPDDKLGYSAAVSSNGDTALVGTYRNDELRGAAYVFVRKGVTWTQQAKLVAPDAETNDWSAQDLGLSADGNIAVVGAVHDDDLGDDSGSAHIYVREGTQWTHQAKLLAADGAEDDHFGSAIDTSADGMTVIVGATRDDDAGISSGSAYVFVWKSDDSRWIQETKLVASDAMAGDLFGRSVSISGDGSTAIVGSYSDAPGGSAYVFVRTGSRWQQLARLTSSDNLAHANFGDSVSLSDDGTVALVGAPNSFGIPAGAAYLFARDGDQWVELWPYYVCGGDWSDQFGGEVEVSPDGTIGIISAIWYDTIFESGGAAFIHDLSIPPCRGDLNCDGVINAQDLAWLLAYWGPCDNCNDCIAELDRDCAVGVSDLLILLSNWG